MCFAPSLKFPSELILNSSRVCLIMALSDTFKEDIEGFLFQRLSPPGDQWCDVLGFVPASCVSSSSAFQI